MKPIAPTDPSVPRIHWLTSGGPHRPYYGTFDPRGPDFPCAVTLRDMPRAPQGFEGLPDGITERGPPRLDVLTPQLPNVVIQFKRAPVPLPDVLNVQGETLVNARARAAFERIDPEGGHVFVPTFVFDAGGAPIAGDWAYMICGRVFHGTDQEPDGAVSSDAMAGCGLKASTYRRHLATPERRAFFAEQPLWTRPLNLGLSFLSAPACRAVQEAGLTGMQLYRQWGGLPFMGKGSKAKNAIQDTIATYWWATPET